MKHKNLFAEALGDPSKNILLYLVFGIFATALACDALSELVFNNLASWTEKEWGTTEEIFRVVILMGIVSVILLAVNWQKMSDLLANQYAPTTVRPQTLLTTFPGLITVMSKVPPEAISPAEAAIEHHWQNGNGNLRHCWLICGGPSLKSALILLKKLTGQNFEENLRDFTLSHPDNSNRKLKISLKEIDISNIDDPNVSFKLANQIYEEAAAEEMEPENIIVDYTGGTKSMTAGLILACASSERRLQFMRPGGYDAEGRADRNLPSKATEVKIAFKLKAMRD